MVASDPAQLTGLLRRALAGEVDPAAGLHRSVPDQAAEVYTSPGAFDAAANRAAIAALEAPVLLLAGGLDGGPLPRVAAEVAQLFPRAELAVQPGAGHYPWLDDDTIEQRVAARLERQETLQGKTAMVFGFVISEAALRSGVGGSVVMKEQLDRLVRDSARRNVTIQVMPLDGGAHMGLNGPMLLLETTEGRTLAYVESQQVRWLIADREEVSVFAQQYGIPSAGSWDEGVRLSHQTVGRSSYEHWGMCTVRRRPKVVQEQLQRHLRRQLR